VSDRSVVNDHLGLCGSGGVSDRSVVNDRLGLCGSGGVSGRLCPSGAAA
jgi:hypothetical protein